MFFQKMLMHKTINFVFPEMLMHKSINLCYFMNSLMHGLKFLLIQNIKNKLVVNAS